MTNAEEARRRADASFKRKELQVREGAKAVADYEADARAVEKNTARLRALRLGREEGARQAAAAKKSAQVAALDRRLERRPPRRLCRNLRRYEDRR